MSKAKFDVESLHVNQICFTLNVFVWRGERNTFIMSGEILRNFSRPLFTPMYNQQVESTAIFGKKVLKKYTIGSPSRRQDKGGVHHNFQKFQRQTLL